jgi:hypothetical protein
MAGLIVGVVVLLLLGFFFFRRAGAMRALFDDAHLAEVAAQIPALKQAALALGCGPGQLPDPGAMPVIQTPVMVVTYTAAQRDEHTWEHHLSISNAVTPARMAGTFFLGMVSSLLGLDARPPSAVFVSQHHVFHLVVELSASQQAAWQGQAIPTLDAAALRQLAIDGRSRLMPLLTEEQVPVSPHAARPS